MTRRHANYLGWASIAGVTVLCFVMDYFRMLYSHFNWYMGVLLVVSVGLVAVIWWVERLTIRGGRPETDHSSFE